MRQHPTWVTRGRARDNLRDGHGGGLSALPIIRGGFPGPLAQAGMKSHLWRLEMRVVRTAYGSTEYRYRCCFVAIGYV